MRVCVCVCGGPQRDWELLLLHVFTINLEGSQLHELARKKKKKNLCQSIHFLKNTHPLNPSLQYVRGRVTG